MARKYKVYMTLFVVLSLLLCMVTGCSEKTKNNAAGNKRDVVGKWYNEKGKCLDIRSDGTYKLEDSYGTGTWKLLEDRETYEFLDYYGDSQESIINIDDLGSYIDFGYYGDFYKGAYPSVNELSENNIFKNVKLSVKGASPFCYVSVDTTNCSDFIKEKVDFTIKDGVYKNGDTVIVSASTDGQTTIEKQFTVLDAPEFVDSTDELDLDFLNSAFEKYLNSQKNTAKTGKGEFFGRDDILQTYKLDIKEIELIESGFFVAKPDSIKDFSINPYANCYNSFYHIYGIKALNRNNNKEYLYIGEIIVRNIVKNADGTTSWNVYIDKTDIGELTGSIYDGISEYNRYGSGFPRLYKSGKYTYNVIKEGNNNLIKK